MKSFIVLLFSLLTLVGCASLSDIRSSEPTYQLDSDLPPKTLANCIAYKSQEAMDSWNRFWDPAQVIERDGKYTMLVTLSGGLFVPFTKPMAEVNITANSHGSHIEYRTAPMWGGKDPFWALVKKCAIKTPPENMPD